MSLADTLRIVADTRRRLAHVKGDRAEVFRRKADSVFSKNDGLRVLEAVDRVLRGEATLTDDLTPFTAADVACLKHGPLTSVDVERSFSMLRALLREN